ncbi:MAG: hypothetical protein HW380_2858 [Magnetococcales bacterium]|nr:hypothetical protein [Magnetococcales bacterium]
MKRIILISSATESVGTPPIAKAFHRQVAVPSVLCLGRNRFHNPMHRRVWLGVGIRHIVSS